MHAHVRIQDFHEVGVPTLGGGEEAHAHDFAKSPKNCMKLKEFGPCWGGGGHLSLVQNFTM